MDIAILNYATSEVTIITSVPSEWEEEQITEYLYSEKGLDLRESEIFYMVGDNINLTMKSYESNEQEKSRS